MPSTYSQISTTTLGSSATSITLSSIPQTYTNLVVIANLQLVSGSGAGTLEFNNDTTAKYSVTSILGDGSVSAYRNSNVNVIYFSLSSIPTGTFELATINISQYANTSTFKNSLTRTTNRRTSGGATEASIGLYRSTAAITSIKIANDGGANFATGSSLTLYGIKGA